MNSVTWGFVGTLVGAIVGASVSIVTTIITARNNRKLQQEVTMFERNNRTREFQRENFLELQEIISNGMRLISQAHLADVESFQVIKTESKRPLLSRELNQELMLSNRKLTIFNERVIDKSLRDRVKKLQTKMTNVLMAKTEKESYENLKIALDSFEKTMDTLGENLRDSY